MQCIFIIICYKTLNTHIIIVRSILTRAVRISLTKSNLTVVSALRGKGKIKAEAGVKVWFSLKYVERVKSMWPGPEGGCGHQMMDHLGDFAFLFPITATQTTYLTDSSTLGCLLYFYCSKYRSYIPVIIII